MQVVRVEDRNLPHIFHAVRDRGPERLVRRLAADERVAFSRSDDKVAVLELIGVVRDEAGACRVRCPFQLAAARYGIAAPAVKAGRPRAFADGGDREACTSTSPQLACGLRGRRPQQRARRAAATIAMPEEKASEPGSRPDDGDRSAAGRCRPFGPRALPESRLARTAVEDDEPPGVEAEAGQIAVELSEAFLARIGLTWSPHLELHGEAVAPRWRSVLHQQGNRPIVDVS
jgi:hypothetical protein